MFTVHFAIGLWRTVTFDLKVSVQLFEASVTVKTIDLVPKFEKPIEDGFEFVDDDGVASEPKSQL